MRVAPHHRQERPAHRCAPRLRHRKLHRAEAYWHLQLTSAYGRESLGADHKPADFRYEGEKSWGTLTMSHRPQTRLDAIDRHLGSASGVLRTPFALSSEACGQQTPAPRTCPSPTHLRVESEGKKLPRKPWQRRLPAMHHDNLPVERWSHQRHNPQSIDRQHRLHMARHHRDPFCNSVSSLIQSRTPASEVDLVLCRYGPAIGRLL